MENIVDDAALARELHRQFNAYGNRRSSGRTAYTSSAVAIPQPIAIKKLAKTAPADSRPVRFHLSKKASDSESSPDSATAKHARSAKTSTAIKKRAQSRRKSITGNESTPSQPSARLSKSSEPDVVMQDAINANIVSSPTSSELSQTSSSEASSFKPQSSASSCPFSEPIENQIVDEAEKDGLLESAGVANNQFPVHGIPALGKVAPAIAFNATIPIQAAESLSKNAVLPVAPALPVGIPKPARTIGTRRKPIVSKHPQAIGFTHINPADPDGPPVASPKQHVQQQQDFSPASEPNPAPNFHQQLNFAPQYVAKPAQSSLQRLSFDPQPVISKDHQFRLNFGPPTIGSDADFPSRQWLRADLPVVDPLQTIPPDSEHATLTRPRATVPAVHFFHEAPRPEPDAIMPPKNMGQPPVWAHKRQQLCEVLPYYNAYQSGVYMSAGIIHSMMIDGESRPQDIFTNEIIITRCGGGRGAADANGHRAQAKDQQSSPIGLAFERARVNKLAIVVIAGNNYKNSTCRGSDFLPYRYNVLGHFKVTDVWLELNDNFCTFVCRLEKVHIGERSWWATEPYMPSMYNLDGTYNPNIFQVKAPSYRCRRCQAVSKTIFAQGWVCMNVNCLSYFKMVDHATGYEAVLGSPQYSEAFKAERSPYEGGASGLVPLVPRLMTEQDMVLHSRTGTEEIFSKGIVCPICKCCSRRIHFKRWTCENGCNFVHELAVRTLTADQANLKGVKNVEKYPKVASHNGVSRTSEPVGHFDVDQFEIKTREGEFIGYVRHFKSNDLVNALEDGPDDLFREMQENDFGLMRRAVRQKGSSGEILTSHYASNWGAPYKFVVAQSSRPFTDAPRVIVKALKKMTWAGQSCVAKQGPAFQDFNELLSIGYLENTKIGYHDDGEKELGPTIATLSLGAQAVMMLRPKKSTPEGMGTSRNNAKGTKAEDLEILLNHGDIIIMHGEKLQKYYEHQVIPAGTLRYALTCRTILPEKLQSDDERNHAARLAVLPDGHEAWNYDGNKIIQPTEDEIQVARSRQMVLAMQRTLDDLQTMLQISSGKEVAQLNDRIDEVIAAYRRVTDGTQIMCRPEGADGAATDAEVEDCVMIPQTATTAGPQNSQMELASNNGEAVGHAQNSQAQLFNNLIDEDPAAQGAQNELDNVCLDAASDAQDSQMDLGNKLAGQASVLQEVRTQIISRPAIADPEAQVIHDSGGELANNIGEKVLNTKSH